MGDGMNSETIFHCFGHSQKHWQGHLANDSQERRSRSVCCLALCRENRLVIVRSTPTTVLLPLCFSCLACPHFITCVTTFTSVLEGHSVSIFPEGYNKDLRLVLPSNNKQMTLNKANISNTCALAKGNLQNIQYINVYSDKGQWLSGLWECISPWLMNRILRYHGNTFF
jgi:hypothetical protein